MIAVKGREVIVSLRTQGGIVGVALGVVYLVIGGMFRGAGVGWFYIMIPILPFAILAEEIRWLIGWGGNPKILFDALIFVPFFLCLFALGRVGGRLIERRR